MGLKIKNLDKIGKNLIRKAKAFENDASEMRKVGAIISNDLLTNFNQGKGSSNRRFPSLKTATVRRRKRLSEFNTTDSNFSPKKSNITFTGEFKRSRRVFFKGRGLFEIKFVGIHSPYNLVRGGKTKRVPNADIAQGLIDLGYKLNGIPLQSRKKIVNQFRKYLKRQLK